MRSKESYFSISLPLIKENFRRFWAIPAIAFLVYFLSGVFPILMSYDKINNLATYIDMSMKNQQPFYMMAHLIVPVTAAVVLFRYLQSSSSAAVMHTMPFTRTKLFNSNFLTGLIMSIAPILINGIILLAISKPTFTQWDDGNGLTTAKENVFSRMDVVNWIWVSVIIVAVLFSISVFSGIVTGNMFIHLMASYFFIFVITALYGVFYLYFEIYLYGFNTSGQWEEICLAISPYTQVIAGGGTFTLTPLLYYIFTFVALFVVSAILYRRRKLERASDSLVFDFLKPIICYIIAFLGMTMIGMYFYALGESKFSYLYAGFAAGAALFFIIGQMIIQKTPRVFNLANLKGFGIFLLIAAIFVAGIRFDVVGYENRTPKLSSVKSAQFNPFFGSYFSGFGDEKAQVLRDPQNLAAIVAFHQAVVENKTALEAQEKDGNGIYTTVFNFEYDLNGPLDMSRSYSIDYAFFSESPQMKQIFESLEFKTTHSLYALGAKKFTEVSLYTDQYWEEGTPTFKKASDVEELVAAIEKDMRAMTYEEAISMKRLYASVDISYLYQDENTVGGSPETRSINLGIPDSFTNTIGWLNANGYDFSLNADRVVSINIYDITDDLDQVIDETDGYTVISTDGTHTYYSYDEYEKKYGAERKPVMTLTDKASIQKVLDSYDRDRLTVDNSYSVEIKYTTGTTDPDVPQTETITGYLNNGLSFLK